MKRVDTKIKEQLWTKMVEGSDVFHALRLMIEGPGPKVPRGSSKKVETRKAMEELIRIVYDYALDQGYDMGHAIFGCGE